jgi:GT2 family glycosyltransferase
LVRTERRGVAGARNLGESQARGEYVVFIDAHCRVSPNWLGEFVDALSRPEVAVVGPCFTRLDAPTPRGCGTTWRGPTLDQVWFEPDDGRPFYTVPMTPGGCQAFRRDTFAAIGRYEQGFSRWGWEDLELCMRAWLLGYQVGVCPRAVVAHDFRETRSFEVLDEDILYNLLRMVHMHFSAKNIRGVLRAICHHPGVERALDRLYDGDIFELRRSLVSKRAYSDDWFFARFDMEQQNHRSFTAAEMGF